MKTIIILEIIRYASDQTNLPNHTSLSPYWVYSGCQTLAHHSSCTKWDSCYGTLFRSAVDEDKEKSRDSYEIKWCLPCLHILLSARHMYQCEWCKQTYMWFVIFLLCYQRCLNILLREFLRCRSFKFKKPSSLINRLSRTGNERKAEVQQLGTFPMLVIHKCLWTLVTLDMNLKIYMWNFFVSTFCT